MIKAKTIYCLQNSYITEEVDMSTFIFCWKNWDYYFTECVHDCCEKIENVVITRQYGRSHLDYDKEQDLYLVAK